MRGEAYLAGGAVMCLVFQARPAIKDIDAMAVPAAEVRAAAHVVAAREGLSEDWLNDVKGFFSEQDLGDVAVLIRVLKLRTIAEAESIRGPHTIWPDIPPRPAMFWN